MNIDTKKILLYTLILYVVIDIIRKFDNPLKNIINNFIENFKLNSQIKNKENNDTNNTNNTDNLNNNSANNTNDTNNSNNSNNTNNTNNTNNLNDNNNSLLKLKKRKKRRRDSLSRLDDLIQMSDTDDDDLEFINDNDENDNNQNLSSNTIKNTIKNKNLSDDTSSLEKIPEDNTEEMYDENYLEKTLVYFIISINEEIIGRIVIKLFDEEVPITCKNFRELSYSSPIVGDDKPAYENSSFHRTIKDFMVQSGKLLSKDVSIYGETFEDENFDIKHSEAGLISMSNEGPDTNSSQFFILTQPAPHLDGKNVVFGKVIDGMDIVKIIEESPTKDDIPIDNIKIYESGLLGPINLK